MTNHNDIKTRRANQSPKKMCATSTGNRTGKNSLFNSFGFELKKLVLFNR